MGKVSAHKKPSLYVGCALTDAPQQFRDAIENLKDSLANDWNVLKFLGLTDGTSEDVYHQDIGNVRACDAFLAVADHASTGLGWELGTADYLDKPTLVVARLDAKVTRLILGAADANPSISFRRYIDMTEAYDMCRAILLPQLAPKAAE